MRKILLGVVITVVAIFIFKYFSTKKEEQIVLQESSALIQKQIQNVGKLIVTEGHFSEVFNYKNSKGLFGEYITSKKKALVVVNAEVSIVYNLSKIEFEIDELNKTLTIIKIPKEEIKISPDLEYYDVQSDYFNPFEAKDYNRIKKIVNASLKKKIDQSDFKKNAQNRLISELSKFYILTNSLGWTLKYNSNPITENAALQNIKL